MIANVIPEKKVGPDKAFYSYKIPAELDSQIKIGSIVTIPFGKEKIRGVVYKLSVTGNQLSVGYKVKKIISVDDQFSFPKSYLEVANWISKYYLCSLGEAVSLFLPPQISRTRKTELRIMNYELSKKIKLTSEQEEIFGELRKMLSYCSNGFDKLTINSAKTKNIDSSRPEASNNNVALLHGVTGSGKTEIYIKLTEENLKRGKQTIVLVPEIILTPQLVRRFKEYFPEEVCLMHSNLSKSERFSSYQEFTNGKKQIIIGPRSALLVPSNNLGLIIVDEEHENAYKQEKAPRYNAVELAREIARESKAMLLLGSATPSIDSYYKTTQYCHSRPVSECGINSGGNPGLDHWVHPSHKAMEWHGKPEDDIVFNLFELKNRYHKLILPPAEIVDLRQEIKSGNYSPISEKLKKELEKIIADKKQAILFINRRGAATFVSCRDCGYVIMCPRCSIPLVYHIHFREQFLSCHHCDYKTTIPKICPGCKGTRIKYFGSGIEKIEIEINKLFPKAKVKMVDSKLMGRKGSYHTLYEDLNNKKIDILIGTQIVAKGLDLPEVDLVGIVSADTGLHLPYYMANEKVFQILTQVSGRSGRKNNCGKTIIQTYWPDSKAIKFAAQHDFKDFFESEIIDRKKHNYPPFCQIVRVVSEDKKDEKAKNILEKIARLLKKNDLVFIGPAPCFYSRLNNKYRFHILIKAKSWPDKKIYDIFKVNPYLIWDVDPTNLL